ncbi:unnamed protein product, partial [Polarella glacialis]
ESEAAHFLRGWSGVSDFGLDLEWKPTFQAGEAPSRSALLQISSGPWVLIFDLFARRRMRSPMPDCLWKFLTNESHTFYGMGLVEDLARLAFEFDTICHGVDFARRAWPEIVLGGGLGGLGNRVLGTTVQQSKKVTMSNWQLRPLSQVQLTYLAEDAYLSWAVADHFLIERKAPVCAEWPLTMAELYAGGRKFLEHGLAVPKPAYDWTAARLEHEEAAKAKAAQRIIKAAAWAVSEAQEGEVPL